MQGVNVSVAFGCDENVGCGKRLEKLGFACPYQSCIIRLVAM